MGVSRNETDFDNIESWFFYPTIDAIDAFDILLVIHNWAVSNTMMSKV